jgi:hypothetical protein
MDEVLPGIYHWTGHDMEVAAPVHSYYVEPAGALIDPVMPVGGTLAFAGMTPPQQVIVTNRRHVRDSDRFAQAFGCKIRAALAGLEAFDGLEVEPFGFGDEVAWGVTAVEMGRIFPEEVALLITHGNGAIALGDVLSHPSGAPLAFPPDDLLGGHPDRIKRALKAALWGLLIRDFDALLLSHGAPLADDAKAALRRFVEEPVEEPEFGPYA